MKLKEWRDANRRSAVEVAEELGCTRQAVHRYENGRLPDFDRLEAIVRLTGGEVTPNDWFDFHTLAPITAGEPDFPGMCRKWISLLYAPEAS